MVRAPRAHTAERRRTIDEEEVRGAVLLPPVCKVAYYAVDVVRRRHEEVHGLHGRLGLAVARDGLDDCAGVREGRLAGGETDTRTSDVLLQDVKLLQHGAQELLRVLVYHENLPPPGGIDGPDRVEEL